jgi:prepilin-type N-terminal cleavage/methylation domain-containing protein/prepilin-type processing-associated H-X9-DG protein
MRVKDRTKLIKADFRKGGFTLIELLVVIAIIAILASLLLPALSKAKMRGQSIACMAKLKQLQLAWIMYCDDFNGRMPQNIADDCPNFANGSPTLTSDHLPGGIYAQWVLGTADSAPQWTNDFNLTQGTLWPYLNSLPVYKCPGDTARDGNRNYSMNSWLNGVNSFLNGTTPQPWNTQCYWYQKVSDLVGKMEQTTTMVFVDEGAATMNDGFFAENPADPTTWIDCPAHYHINGSNLSYVDGHVANRRWSDGNVLSGQGGWGAQGVKANPLPSDDLRWLQAQCSIMKSR